MVSEGPKFGILGLFCLHCPVGGEVILLEGSIQMGLGKVCPPPFSWALFFPRFNMRMNQEKLPWACSSSL